MPVFNVAETWLRQAITSVTRQLYANWELCVVDDASSDPHVRMVIEEYAAKDPRIKPVFAMTNAGIAMASNAGLQAASGAFVALLDHDDELAPEALLEVAKLLNHRPELDLIYTDEDKIDRDGNRCDPASKPGWSPDLLLSMNYICHLTVVRTTRLNRLGGFRAGFDGSQDYDLVLRVTEQADKIAHIPKVLYHWRKIPGSAAESFAAKPQASTAVRRAFGEALGRRGVDGSVDMVSHGRYRVRYAVPEHPLVSIIIPTKDRIDLLSRCLESIQSKTAYRKYKILVIDNNSEETATRRYFFEIAARHVVVSYPPPFNWAAINNFASRRATGAYLLFLNNDVEAIEPEWLEALLEPAQRKDVGAVGAKLLFPNHTIQHAGAVLGIGGVCGHAFKGLPGDTPGYLDHAKAVRNDSAVTGACLMTRRDVFQSVGGFDEQLRVAFSDIDFCLRVRDKGCLIVYTPCAALYHHESATRGHGVPKRTTA
jgi:GT2 family glycosyltransferase